MIQRLLDNGHSRADIMGYTQAQVDGFLQAIEREDARRAQRIATAVRVASHGNKGTWSRFLSELESAANGR